MKKLLKKTILIQSCIFALPLILCASTLRAQTHGSWEIAGTNAPRREGHSMTVLDEKVYVFGGADRQLRSDLLNSLSWADAPYETWEQITPETAPPARRDHCASALNGKLYIFGGQGSSSQLMNDVWMYDPAFTNWFLQDVEGTKPTPRYLSASVVYSNRLLVFGGEDSTGYRGDLWEYNPEATNWTLLKAEDPPFNSPPTRKGASAFIAQERVYVFGGENEYGYPQQDMWNYNPQSGTWMDTAPSGELPKPVTQYASAYSTNDNTFWLSGGKALNTEGLEEVIEPVADTWIFDLGDYTWTRQPNAPMAFFDGWAVEIPVSPTARSDTTNASSFLLLGGTIGDQTSDQFLRFRTEQTSQTIYYNYDAAGRLTNAAYVEADAFISYRYDANGNIIARTVKGRAVTLSCTVTNFALAPERFMPGETIDMTCRLDNTGDQILDGTLYMSIHNSDGTLIQTIAQTFSNLTVGGHLDFSTVWTNLTQVPRDSQIIAYAVSGGSTSTVQTVSSWSNAPFFFSNAQSLGSRVLLQWPSVSGRTYSVDRATNLLDGSGFSTIENDLPATPPVNSYTNSSTHAFEAWRVREN
jgi:YD repeat-containing protein